MEEKYRNINPRIRDCSKKILELEDNKKKDKEKENDFNQKIDELNQETEYLIEEIDKWQI